MYSKILVALDMSERAETVFNSALSLATSNGSSLLLLHVLSSEEDYSPLPIPSDLWELYPAGGNDLTVETWRQQWVEFEKTGMKTLQSRVNMAKEKGIEAQYQQSYGNPARTICRVAKEWPADLIVLGRRGRSGLGELLLGSVSNHVLHHAHCCILTVQSPK
ncbi:MAG: putative universal stress protein [Chroococcopsis gigantea SAG 12.99]|jgi:nucleotide-binding universal stress UspA family protein|nr:universal stress protein [Chlorogloea purpurea SAG 13.99]MDV3001644.1 putative universal stress protein [Chroococcopsis gigantea SAG 12.99]